MFVKVEQKVIIYDFCGFGNIRVYMNGLSLEQITPKSPESLRIQQ